MIDKTILTGIFGGDNYGKILTLAAQTHSCVDRYDLAVVKERCVKVTNSIILKICLGGWNLVVAHIEDLCFAMEEVWKNSPDTDRQIRQRYLSMVEKFFVDFRKQQELYDLVRDCGTFGLDVLLIDRREDRGNNLFCAKCGVVHDDCCGQLGTVVGYKMLDSCYLKYRVL